MGANGSREVSIGEGETKDSLPRSSTLPAGLKGLGGKFNFSGTLPRGLGLDSSFSVKLTKSKKIDGSPSKKDLDETKVEIVAKEKAEEEKAEKEETEDTEKQGEVEEETLADFIESLLSKVVEDTIEKSRKMKKSSTLPATFRGDLIFHFNFNITYFFPSVFTLKFLFIRSRKSQQKSKLWEKNPSIIS